MHAKNKTKRKSINCWRHRRRVYSAIETSERVYILEKRYIFSIAEYIYLYILCNIYYRRTYGSYTYTYESVYVQFIHTLSTRNSLRANSGKNFSNVVDIYSPYAVISHVCVIDRAKTPPATGFDQGARIARHDSYHVNCENLCFRRPPLTI